MTYLWCCFEVLLITGQLSEQLELVVLQDINTLKASNNVKCYHWPTVITLLVVYIIIQEKRRKHLKIYRNDLVTLKSTCNVFCIYLVCYT